MPTSIPGQPAPAPDAGFEVPLEMLSACHHRIERQCATLVKLDAHLVSHGADEQATAAATAILRYFDTAAKDHHADEEIDLFPALIESMAGSDPVCIREMVGGLIIEHRELDALWRRLRPALLEIAAGRAAALLHADVDTFVSLQARHTAREDDELLPMAGRLLSDDALAQIGRAMRERRGILSID